MCEKRRSLRAQVTERLTAAADEIFALFERTIAEYEEELSRSKEENQRKQRLLDSALRPQLRLHRTHDVQIQTESHKEESAVKEEAETSPQIRSVIVKSEDLESGEEEEPVHMETEGQGGANHQAPTLDQNTATETSNGINTNDASDGNEADRMNRCSINKKKRKITDSDGAEEARKEARKRERKKGKKEARKEERKEGRTGAEPGESEQGGDSETTMSSPRDAQEALRRDSAAAAQSKCSKRRWMCLKGGGAGPSVTDKRGVNAQFGCAHCEKTFHRLDHLERHTLTHTEERSFSCSVCLKSFRLKQHLMSHVSIHTDEKLYSCSVCPKKFKRKDNLGRHIKNHSGDRPFGCSECDVRFSLKKNLLRHMIVHSRDVTFSCSVCNMTFSSPFYFQKHKKTHKKKKVPQ